MNCIFETDGSKMQDNFLEVMLDLGYCDFSSFMRAFEVYHRFEDIYPSNVFNIKRMPESYFKVTDINFLTKIEENN